jgi:hypothetical protein
VTSPLAVSPERLAQSLSCDLALLQRAASDLGVVLGETIHPRTARALGDMVRELSGAGPARLAPTVDTGVSLSTAPTVDPGGSGTRARDCALGPAPTRDSPDRADVRGTFDSFAASPDGRAAFNLPSPLDEQYVWFRDLESGSQADVQLVTERNSGCRMIAKRYRQADARLHAIADAVALGQLDHPNLVKIKSLGECNDGRWWEIQQYVGHGTLQELASSLSWRPDMVIEVVRQLAHAISHLHAAELVHRDVKPTNVFIRSIAPLDVVLGDLGLAKFLGGASYDYGSLVGTWPYAPPEVGQTSPAFDWWSLGMVTLELADAHPFRTPEGRWLADGEMDRRRNHELIRVPDTFDPRLKNLCEGLLTWDRIQRPGLSEASIRWTDTQITAWLDGEDPPVNRKPPPDAFNRPQITATLAGITYTSLEQIAAAMSRDHRFARRILAGRTQGKDFKSLRACFVLMERNDLISALDHFPIEDDNALDDSLARLIGRMSPTIPATYHGRDVTEAGLRALVAEAATNPDTLQLLCDLANTAILSIYSSDSRPDGPRLARIDSVWTRGLELIDKINPTSEQRRSATISLLRAEIDPTYRDQLSVSAAKAASDPLAGECAWFARIPSGSARSRVDQVTLTLLLESARDEARETRARAAAEAAEQRRQAEEQDRLVREQDRLAKDRDRQAEEVRRGTIAASRRRRQAALFRRVRTMTAWVIVAGATAAVVALWVATVDRNNAQHAAEKAAIERAARNGDVDCYVALQGNGEAAEISIVANKHFPCSGVPLKRANSVGDEGYWTVVSVKGVSSIAARRYGISLLCTGAGFSSSRLAQWPGDIRSVVGGIAKEEVNRPPAPIDCRVLAGANVIRNVHIRMILNAQRRFEL